MALSPTNGLGAANNLYSTVPEINDWGNVMDNQGTGTSPEGLLQGWIQHTGFMDTTITRASMSIQSGLDQTILYPVSRSHVSLPYKSSSTPAPVAAALLPRQGHQHSLHDSVQSTSSYNTVSTDLSMDTKHTSMTSMESQSSHSSRKLPPQNQCLHPFPRRRYIVGHLH